MLPPPFFSMAEITIRVQSRTDPGVVHIIVIDSEKQTVHCSCDGFRFKGRCEHIKFYKKLIKSLIDF